MNPNKRIPQLWIIIGVGGFVIMIALCGLLAAFSSGESDADEMSAFQSPVITATATITPTATAMPTITPTATIAPTPVLTPTMTATSILPFQMIEVSFTDPGGANCHFRLQKDGWMQDLTRIPAGTKIAKFGEAYAPIGWDPAGDEQTKVAQDAELSNGNFNMWAVAHNGKVCFIRKALTRAENSY